MRAISQFFSLFLLLSVVMGCDLGRAADGPPKSDKAEEIKRLTAEGDAEKEREHYKESLTLYQKALDLVDKSDDPKQWCILALNVADAHGQMADWKKEEALSPEILALCEEHFGENSSVTAAALDGLGKLYWATKRPTEAEPLLRRALAIDEKNLGKDDPKIGIRLSNLAKFLHTNSQQTEAEPLYRRSIEISEKAFGNEDVKVAEKLTNLASLLTDTGRYAEAEAAYRRSLQIEETALGKEHPKLSGLLRNFARLQSLMQENEKAEKLYLRALAIDEVALGKNNPELFLSLNQLAMLYINTQRLKEAEPLMLRSLNILVNSSVTSGSASPFLSRAIGNYGGLRMQLGDSQEEAQAKVEKIIEPLRKKKE